MFKASIEIAKINKAFKVKFAIIIQSENDVKQSHQNLLVNKFSYMGNDYLRVNPRPFITLDISKGSDKSDGWNTNQSVNLNKQKLFEFIKKFRIFVLKYKEVKSLYYYDEEGKLMLDNRYAKDIFVDMISSNKHIRICPCVVSGDQESEEIFYEGCIFYINNFDNFAYLTYDEMEYLLYELSHIDMVSLSIDMIKLVKMYQEEEKKDVIFKEPTSKEEEEELSSPGRIVRIETPGEIPLI